MDTLNTMISGVRGRAEGSYIQPSDPQITQPAYQDEIANYVGWTNKKHMAVFVQAVELLDLTMPTEPPEPAGNKAVTME